MNVYGSAWAEAQSTFSQLHWVLDAHMRAAASATVPPDVVEAELYPVSYRAAVLVQAAFGCFRSPPSGARFVIALREVRPDRYRIVVQIVYGPLFPERSKAAVLRELGPCPRCGSRAHWVGEDGSSYNGKCRQSPERLP